MEPISRKKLRRLEQSFTLDGNKMTFFPPEYEPLFDMHLKPFFLNLDRLRILKRNKLINRRYQVVDNDISRKYAREQLQSRPTQGSFTEKRGSKLLKTRTETSPPRVIPLTESLKHTRHQHLTPMLGGIRDVCLGNRRHTHTNSSGESKKTLSKEKFNIFLSREKSKVKIQRSSVEE